LSLWSAKTAGISGHNPTTQAESSTSTWYAFAGHVNRPNPLLRLGMLLRGMSIDFSDILRDCPLFGAARFSLVKFHVDDGVSLSKPTSSPSESPLILGFVDMLPNEFLHIDWTFHAGQASIEELRRFS
jgi:hypothetical protein